MAAADVFVDTAGFLALWDAGDEYHKIAVRLQRELVNKQRRFVTSDYIVDETSTLLLKRHSHSAASDFLNAMERSSAIHLEWIGSERFQAASNLFRKHSDKEWSFTDCVTFSIMRELKIRDALTSDHHFRQAGFSVLIGR